MINVKSQTKRSTKWHQRFANNINILYGKSENEFQFSLVTTTSWGNFEEIDISNPKIEMVIDGREYETTLSRYKEIIKKNVPELWGDSVNKPPHVDWNALEEKAAKKGPEPVTIEFDHMDWELLREQKKILVHLKDNNEDETICGMVHLIDYIQDYVVDSGQCAEEEVFGKLDED